MGESKLSHLAMDRQQDHVQARLVDRLRGRHDVPKSSAMAIES